MTSAAIWSTQEESEPCPSEDPGFLTVLAITELLFKLKDSMFPLEKEINLTWPAWLSG